MLVTRSQNPNSLTIDLDDGKHIVDQETLQKYIVLNPESFVYSVILPQFGQSFFELRPAEKLTLFSDIMGLDFWLEKSKKKPIVVSVEGGTRPPRSLERKTNLPCHVRALNSRP